MAINIRFFNSNKDHNMVLTGYYTLYNSATATEITTQCVDIFSGRIFPNPSAWKQNAEKVRVYNKKWLEPARYISVNNVWRVHLNVRNREKTDAQSDNHDYMWNECANICAFYQRKGSAGGERIVWYIGNRSITEADWLNNRAWPTPPAPIKPTPPARPTLVNENPKLSNATVTLVSIDSTSATISWSKATDKETPQNKLRYTVMWCETPYSTDKRKTGGTIYVNTYKITGLKSNTSYDIYVYVLDEAGASVYYSKKTIKTTAASTGATTNEKPKLSNAIVTLVSIDSTSATVSWSKATDKETPQNKLRYTVTWCETPYSTAKRKVGGTIYVNTYKITGLKSNTSYDIYVYVHDEAGASVVYAKKTIKTLKKTDAERRKEINDFFASRLGEGSMDMVQAAMVDQNQKSYIDAAGKKLVKYEEVIIDNPVQEFFVSYDNYNIYPGMLLVVDDSLGSETPTELRLPRGGTLNINLSLPNFDIEGGCSRPVKPNDSGNFASAVNNAIYDICNNFIKSGYNVTAELKDEQTEGYSSEEMALKIGCSASYKGLKASAEFESQKNSCAKQFMTNYSQVFFTAYAEDPTDFSTLFADSVTAEDIEKAIGKTGNSPNPIIFVSSVKYGRTLFLTEELEASSSSLIQKASLGYNGVCNLDISESYSKKNSSVSYKKKLYIKGGDIIIADSLFGTPPKREPDDSEETYLSKLVQQTRNSLTEFQKGHRGSKVNETVFTDVNGAVMSYRAKMLCKNLKDVTFWNNGKFRVKKIYKLDGCTINFFNSNKDHNMVLCGYYKLFNKEGGEILNVYHDIFGDGVYSDKSAWARGAETIRVYNKKWMAEKNIAATNIYSVYLKVRNREEGENKAKDHTYKLDECVNIRAFYQRAGKGGGERIVWYLMDDVLDEEDWYNGGE